VQVFKESYPKFLKNKYMFRFFLIIVVLVSFACNSDKPSGGNTLSTVPVEEVSISAEEKTALMGAIETAYASATAAEKDFQTVETDFKSRKGLEQRFIDKISYGRSELIQIIADLKKHKDAGMGGAGLNKTLQVTVNRLNEVILPGYTGSLKMVVERANSSK
jgi:hypothetical protein